MKKPAGLITFDKHPAIKIEFAQTWANRLIGLLLTKQSDFTALLITPCTSVHTFLMRYPIDVVFLDQNQRIVKFYKHVTPFKMCFGTRDTFSVLELPSGSINKYAIKISDSLKIQQGK